MLASAPAPVKATTDDDETAHDAAPIVGREPALASVGVQPAVASVPAATTPATTHRVRWARRSSNTTSRGTAAAAALTGSPAMVQVV